MQAVISTRQLLTKIFGPHLLRNIPFTVDLCHCKLIKRHKYVRLIMVTNEDFILVLQKVGTHYRVAHARVKFRQVIWP